MLKENIYVSIIMNCFNGEEFLVEAIDSVFNQTCSDWEIIFFDNASTDGSGEIAKSYGSKLKYYRINKTVPLGEARSKAIMHASGKYLAFLDCDDLYVNNKLAKQTKVMDDNSFVMSYGSAGEIDKDGLFIRNCLAVNSSGNIFGELLLNYEINMQSVMLLRSYLLENDLAFSGSLQYGPDYDLFMQIASTEKVGVLHEIIGWIRIHQGALTRKLLHCVRDELKSTIDRLTLRNPSLKVQYQSELKSAYAKFEFYHTRYLISQGDNSAARATIKPVIKTRWAYFLLYLLLLLPLPRSIFMRLIFKR
ncbi:glycosyltransferase [Pseudomonadales bacterium]|nr:glycosyltransferase [Pseudomonadales bacterium]MDC0893263.1 glycosyltransferase [Pseudomonadales bacterium]